MPILNILSPARKVFILALCISLLSFNSIAQESKSLVDEIWFQYYNNYKTSEKWSIVSDVGYRLKEGNFVDLTQYFLRSGVGYSISPSVRVLLGTAYFNAHYHGEGKATEIRPYQELTTKHKFGKLDFGNRVRIEERFRNIDFTDETTSSNSFNFRFRYRFSFDFPLFHISESNSDIKFSLTVGDEVLLSAGKEKFFDVSLQNRILIGPTIKFNEKSKFFMLYNFTSVSKNIPNISEEYGILWVGFKQTFEYNKQ